MLAADVYPRADVQCSRWSQIFTASGFTSMPMKHRAVFAAATRVVPLPHIGYSTTPPGGKHASTSSFNNASGVGGGYPTRSWDMLLIAGISITSAAFVS